MSDITATLTQLGLTEKEALTYTTLLELGDSSAYAISKKSGLKKPTTYVVLDELRKKDLVIKKPQAKRTLYVAKDPGELLNIAQENLLKTQEILPRLKSLSKKENLEVQTLFFDGLKETKDALLYNIDEIRGKEMVGFYAYAGDSEKMKEIYPTLIKWGESIIERNISMRGIAPKHESLEQLRKEDAQYNREFKEVDFSEYSSEISIDVFGSAVRIVDLIGHQAVIIDNPRVAKTMKEIFEMVWKK